MTNRAYHASPVSCSPIPRFLAAAGLAIVAALGAGTAMADDFIVYSPHVQVTQSEIELRGYRYDDPRGDYHGGAAAELSLAHAFTPWWKAELYLAKYQKAPGEGEHLLGYEFENTFQLTPAGEYWADFGFLAAYEHNTRPGVPDTAEFGPLIAKAVGRFTHTVNLIWEKQLGAGAAGKYEFRYSYQGTYTLSSAFRPGIEAYGRPADHAYQAGPVIAGDWYIPGTRSELEYRFGVVLGLNAAAPRRTWLAQLEYEFF